MTMDWVESVEIYGELGARALEQAEAMRAIEEWLG